MGQWYTFDAKSDAMARKIRRALRDVHTVQGSRKLTYALIGNGESKWVRKMEASLAVVVRVAVHPGPTAKTPCGVVMLDRIVGKGQTLVSLHQKRCKTCRALLAVLTITGPDPASAVETPPAVPESIPAEPTEPAKAVEAVIPSPEIPGLGPSIQALSQIQEQAFTLATEAESAITACKRALDAEARLEELQRKAAAQQETLQALVADLSGRLGARGGRSIPANTVP